MRITVKHESLTIGIEDGQKEATVRISAEDTQIEVQGSDGERAIVPLDDDLTIAKD